MPETQSQRVLVTGSTGYVGGRLVPRLLENGYHVRVMARDPERIKGRPWSDKVEIVEADLLVHDERLTRALDGIEVAYYLVHSMHAGASFAELDKQAAKNFVAAGKHLHHVIYLGGLFPQGDSVSAHLKSRAETGEILRAGLPTTEFRAGPIVGSGSASFEMVRYLTERLPVMVAPHWIHNEVQPIAIRDVLSYLIRCINKPPLGVIDIGADRTTFKKMLETYAEVRHYRRWIFSIPFMAPRLAAGWVNFVSPVPDNLVTPLIEGVVSHVLADTKKAEIVFPYLKPITYKRAVELALVKIEQGDVETSWSNALGRNVTYEHIDWEGVINEVRSHYVEMPPETAFAAFSSLGGENGWLVWNWAWRIRGYIDSLLGGPGLRRGRRDPYELLPGDALDFWRVEAVKPPMHLRLRAEMKVPGKAWLQFEATPEGTGTRIVQKAIFVPDGFGGYLYWYALYPIHKMIFSDLMDAVAKRAVEFRQRISS